VPEADIAAIRFLGWRQRTAEIIEIVSHACLSVGHIGLLALETIARPDLNSAVIFVIAVEPPLLLTRDLMRCPRPV
jgi:hypothetical protein